MVAARVARHDEAIWGPRTSLDTMGFPEDPLRPVTRWATTVRSGNLAPVSDEGGSCRKVPSFLRPISSEGFGLYLAPQSD